MPGIPDLEVVKDFLNERIVGRAIVRAEAPRPWVVRALAAADFVEDAKGRTFRIVPRVGKDLLLPLEEDRTSALRGFDPANQAFVLPAGSTGWRVGAEPSNRTG